MSPISHLHTVQSKRAFIIAQQGDAILERGGDALFKLPWLGLGTQDAQKPVDSGQLLLAGIAGIAFFQIRQGLGQDVMVLPHLPYPWAAISRPGR